MDLKKWAGSKTSAPKKSPFEIEEERLKSKSKVVDAGTINVHKRLSDVVDQARKYNSKNDFDGSKAYVLRDKIEQDLDWLKTRHKDDDESVKIMDSAIAIMNKVIGPASVGKLPGQQYYKK